MNYFKAGDRNSTKILTFFLSEKDQLFSKIATKNTRKISQLKMSKNFFNKNISLRIFS